MQILYLKLAIEFYAKKKQYCVETLLTYLFIRNTRGTILYPKIYCFC